MKAEPGAVKRLRKPKSRFHHGDLFEAAVSAATAELQARGYAELTLERVAKRLGVTRPALYRHFPDKRALLSEVSQRFFERFEAAMTDAMASSDDPLEALTATGRTYLRFAQEHPEWFRLQFFAPEPLRPMPDLDKTPARYAELMNGALRTLLGKDAPLDVQSAYLSLWGTVHGLSALVVERVWGEMSDAQRFQYADDALLVQLEGLRAQGLARAEGRGRKARR